LVGVVLVKSVCKLFQLLLYIPLGLSRTLNFMCFCTLQGCETIWRVLTDMWVGWRETVPLPVWSIWSVLRVESNGHG